MDPIFTLPAGSDLAEAEALYLPEQLADVGFVYQEMLRLRGALDAMVRAECERRDQEATPPGTHGHKPKPWCDDPSGCYNYMGLQEDLKSAVSVLIRRINGDADVASAAEWVRLNYPDRAGEITSSFPETSGD